MSPAWSGPWEVSKQREKSQTTFREKSSKRYPAPRRVWRDERNGPISVHSGYTARLQLYPSRVTFLYLFFIPTLDGIKQKKHGVEESLRKQEGKKRKCRAIRILLFCSQQHHTPLTHFTSSQPYLFLHQCTAASRAAWVPRNFMQNQVTIVSAQTEARSWPCLINTEVWETRDPIITQACATKKCRGFVAR